MAGLLPRAVLAGAASVLLGSCGPSGGGAATSRAAASDTPPPQPSAPVSRSDAATAIPPQAAAAPPLTPVRKRQPTAAELLRDDPAYAAKDSALDALYQNAKERDPTGQVEREQALAVAERRACAGRACLDAWFRRREAALRAYVQ